MNSGLLIVVLLLGVALGVQVYYARMYAASATRTVRIVWGLNMALLVILMVGLLYYSFALGVNS